MDETIKTIDGRKVTFVHQGYAYTREFPDPWCARQSAGRLERRLEDTESEEITELLESWEGGTFAGRRATGAKKDHTISFHTGGALNKKIKAAAHEETISVSEWLRLAAKERLS